MSDEKIYAVDEFGERPMSVTSVPVLKRTAQQVVVPNTAGLAFGCRTRIPISEAYFTPGDAIDAYLAVKRRDLEQARRRLDALEFRIREAERLKGGGR